MLFFIRVNAVINNCSLSSSFSKVSFHFFFACFTNLNIPQRQWYAFSMNKMIVGYQNFFLESHFKSHYIYFVNLQLDARCIRLWDYCFKIKQNEIVWNLTVCKMKEVCMPCFKKKCILTSKSMWLKLCTLPGDFSALLLIPRVWRLGITVMWYLLFIPAGLIANPQAIPSLRSNLLLPASHIDGGIALVIF